MILKRLLIIFSVVFVFTGAGCSVRPKSITVPQPPAVQSPTTSNTTAASSTVTTKKVADLKELPAVVPNSELTKDDQAWTRTVTRSGVTITAPTKGRYAPTWTYTIVDKNDPNLQGKCYVTDATVYKKTDFENWINVCQTTTEFGSGPGTRVDYFIFSSFAIDNKNKVNLFTFTKTYPAGFDMNGYGVVLNNIIGIID